MADSISMPGGAPHAAWLGLPAWLQGRWGAASVVAAVYLGVYVAWTYFRWGGADYQALISNLAFLPLSFFATLAALRVYADRERDPRLRFAWLVLGVSIFIYFLGDVVWLWYESVLKLSPFPSLADVFYLLFFPLVLWGLLRLPGAPFSPGERLKFLFDMFIVMTVAWMTVWYFVISPTAESNGGAQPFTQLIAAAYPIADLVVIGGIVWLLLRRLEPTLRSALILFMGGLGLFVVTDLLYAHANLTGTYASGGWIDVGWPAAYFLFALAAVRQRHPARAYNRRRLSDNLVEALPLVLPFVAIGMGYGLVIYVAQVRIGLEGQGQGLMWSAAALTVFVVGRQVITLRDNMRLNAELRAFSAELERRVQQRTQELQQSQEALLASQRLAATGALAAGIAHEVGNPLNTIVATVEALEIEVEAMSEADARLFKNYVPIIQRAVWHAARIVQSLRTFSRGSQPELVAQNIAEVVDDALFLMQYQIEHWNKIRVVTDYEPDLPSVLVDRNQLAQVIINLLTNARDAMPEGGVITLRIARTETGVRIEVSDHGVGLSPEQAEKVFAPFYTTKGIGKGSGLGLSIIYGIVRAHSGAVSVHSDGPGKGATFTVSLPLMPQPLPPDE